MPARMACVDLPVSARAGARRATCCVAWFSLGLALVLACLAPAAAAAEGRFEVRSASAERVDGVYFVDARVQYRLSEDALSALESGVALTLELQLEVNRKRGLFPDQNVARLTQAFQLQYHALSDRYLVRNLNTGAQQSFATLFAALNQLGRIVDLPLIDAALLEPEARYEARMRAVLDTRAFPGPLRLLVFWVDGWRIESDWYTWPLEP